MKQAEGLQVVSILMKKNSSFSTQGQREDIGDLGIRRLLSNRYADAVGPFVLLDHIIPVMQTKVNEKGTARIRTVVSLP